MLRILFLMALLVGHAAHAAPWVILPETSITVQVTWRGLKIPMTFPSISGRVDFDERRPETAEAEIAVAAGSVETGLGPANRVARSEDFLAADRYPTIRFELDRLKQTSRSTADVFGRITFRGVTRPIGFKARVFEYGPMKEDPDRFVAGFQLDGAIDRTEFGSTGSLSEVPAVLPIRIRLRMASR